MYIKYLDNYTKSSTKKGDDSDIGSRCWFYDIVFFIISTFSYIKKIFHMKINGEKIYFMNFLFISSMC